MRIRHAVAGLHGVLVHVRDEDLVAMPAWLSSLVRAGDWEARMRRVTDPA